MYCKAGSVGSDSSYETVSEGSSHTYSESSGWSYTASSDYDNSDRRSYRRSYSNYNYRGSSSNEELTPLGACVLVVGGVCCVIFVLYMENQKKIQEAETRREREVKMVEERRQRDVKIGELLKHI